MTLDQKRELSRLLISTDRNMAGAFRGPGGPALQMLWDFMRLLASIVIQGEEAQEREAPLVKDPKPERRRLEDIVPLEVLPDLPEPPASKPGRRRMLKVNSRLKASMPDPGGK